MKVTDNTFAELRSYLRDLRSITNIFPLNKKIYTEGTTANQVAFHTAQSVNYYLRVFILNQRYERSRIKEFTLQHSREEIILSIDKAFEGCQIVISEQVDLATRLKKTKMIHSRGFIITSVSEVIQHVTAHTAEHYGQLVGAL